MERYTELGYGEMILKNGVLNFYQIGEFIIIGITFILLWIFTKKKIFDQSGNPTVLGILNTIKAVSVCVITPFIVTLLSYLYGYTVIFPQSETEYVFFTGISDLVNYVEPLLFIPVTIFLCAYVVYWVEAVCNKKVEV